MAPPKANGLKRKRTAREIEQTTTSKRRRNTVPSSSDTESPIRRRAQAKSLKTPQRVPERILEEDNDRYLVRWIVDEHTTEETPQDWILKEHVDEELVSAWEASEASKTAYTAAPTAGKKRGRPKTAVSQAQLPPPKRPRGRPRKESTQEAQPPPPRRLPGRPRKEAAQGTRAARATRRSPRNSSDNLLTSPAVSPSVATPDLSRSTSSATATPARPSIQPPRPAAAVEIVPRPSFDPQDFERFSQLPPSSSLQDPASSSFKGTEVASSSPQLAPARSFHESGVVQDSQSSTGSASYIPTTQGASGSNQHSSNESASYVPTTQGASGSNQQRSTDPSASYISTTQDASASSKHVSTSTASYIPTTQDASASSKHVSTSTASYIPTTQEAFDSNQQSTISEDGPKETDRARVSTEVEEQASPPPSSPASVPETDPIEPTQSPSQSLTQPQAEARDIPDTLEEATSPTRPGQQFANEREVQDSILESLRPEVETPSQSLLQVVDESEIIESPPPEPEKPFQAPIPSYNTQDDQSALAAAEKSPNPSEGQRTNTGRNSSALGEAVNSGHGSGGPLEPDAALPCLPDGVSRAAEGDTRSVAAFSQEVDAVTQAHHTLQSALNRVVDRRDFAIGQLGATSGSASDPLASQSVSQPKSIAPSTRTPTPHAAQVVPSDLYLSTQDDSADSVRPTTEVVDIPSGPETPNSRHDSSQESASPLQPSVSVVDYSPLPRPPTHSIGTQDSKRPARPQIPMESSPSQPAMDPTLPQVTADITKEPEKYQAQVKALIDEKMRRDLAARLAANPFVPKKREFRPFMLPSQRLPGTRSPSTIPDRSPPQQGPTSLRTVALATFGPAPVPAPTLNSPSYQARAASPVRVASPLLAPAPTSSRVPAPVAATIPTPASAAPSVASVQMDADVLSDDEDLSDAHDSQSLLNDDLGLMPDEHIVPLPMEGRQRSLYMHEIKRDEDLLTRFTTEPQDFDDIAKVQELLQKLGDVETHMDLIWAEAGHSSQATGASTQVQWDTENCVKFRFLGTLLRSLQFEEEMNIIIVVERDDERIFRILEKFCKGKLIDYRNPLKSRRANPDDVEGHLTVTLLSSDSTPVVQPPNAIICLDGNVSATQIRKKKWSVNPDYQTVPIIHLVIPRSIGHIERYVSSTLDTKTRLHTIFCSLAQVHDSIGRPMIDSPTAVKAAEQVANFIISLDQDHVGEVPEWPLPSIGSIKDVIEFLTQQSQSCVSSPPATTASSKRPLDDEHLDPSKRMRMTPQPQASSNAQDETTHISDSMPGTAAQLSKVEQQLREKQRALDLAQADAKASEKRFREHQTTWEKRQLEFEELHRKHRKLLGEFETCKTSLETANRNKDFANERFNKKAAEVEELRTLCAQLQTTNLASNNDLIAQNTQLQKELSESKASEARAVKNAKDREETLEYAREQYRIASESAAEASRENQTLKEELAKANKKASGEVAELKKIHVDRAFDNVKNQNVALKTKNGMLEKLLQSKEDEIARMKSAKEVRMGTRGQSVGPKTPGRTSRAASPSRDRLSNLRNG